MSTLTEIETMTDERLARVEEQLSGLKDSFDDMKGDVRDISKSLESLVRIDEVIRTIQKDAVNNTTIHDEIFKWLRRLDAMKEECKGRETRISALEAANTDTNKKLWDVIKLLLAGILGGLISWGVKKV